MDYGRFVKKLDLPAGFTPPTELRYGDIVATAITRSHLQDDVAGINASIDLIHRTRGGPWPTEPVTEDYAMLHNALRHWLANEFPFWQPYFSNAAIPR
jgi:hypothetical protein